MKEFIQYLLNYKKNTLHHALMQHRLQRVLAIASVPREDASHSTLSGRLIAIRIIAEGSADD